MARRFVLRPGLQEAKLPGIGTITPGTILEGDQYRQYCPQQLVEVLDSTPTDPRTETTQPSTDRRRLLLEG